MLGHHSRLLAAIQFGARLAPPRRLKLMIRGPALCRHLHLSCDERRRRRLAIEVPDRAEDAAIVPVTLRSTCLGWQGATTNDECASETSHFGFGLCTSQIVERAGCLLRGAELSAKVSPYLRHA